MEPRPARSRHPLDNPVCASLAGVHAAFAERRGNAARYLPGMSPFIGMPDDPGPADWAAAAELIGPGGTAVTPGMRAPFPDS